MKNVRLLLYLFLLANVLSVLVGTIAILLNYLEVPITVIIVYILICGVAIGAYTYVLWESKKE